MKDILRKIGGFLIGHKALSIILAVALVSLSVLGANSPFTVDDGDSGGEQFLDDDPPLVPPVTSRPVLDYSFDINEYILETTELPEDAPRRTDIVWDVRDFGAVGNGKADDTQAFKDAIAAAGEYDTIYAPIDDKEYCISDTLVINKNVNLDFPGGLKYTGPKDRPVIDTDALMRCTITIAYIRDSGGESSRLTFVGGYHGFINDDYIGIRMTNSKWTHVNINYVHGFNQGVVCRAQSPGSVATGNGFWFNTISINAIYDCLEALVLCSESKDAWINANTFYNTSIGITAMVFRRSGHHYKGISQRLVDGNVVGGGSNMFYNFRFENVSAMSNGTAFTCIYLLKASNWSFINYRSELDGEGNTLCIMDFQYVKIATSKYEGINSITFIPTSTTLGVEKGANTKGANTTVKIINASGLMCPVDEIYQFSNDRWYTIGFDLSLRSKFLRLTDKGKNDKFTLQGYAFSGSGSLSGTETLVTDYSEKTLEVDNEVSVSIQTPLTLAIKNPSIGSTVSVQVYGGTYSFGVCCLRKDGTLFKEEFDSKGIQLIALNGFFSTPTFSFRKNTSLVRNSFSVMSDEVATVLIKISGSLSGYTVSSNDKTLSVLRYWERTKLNNYDKLFVSSVPTDTSALLGTMVYSETDPSKAWQLVSDNGKRVWAPQ